MLEVQDLYVEVDGIEIIKGVSLTFEDGKVHALMGPNGSGKSTLAHAMMGDPKYTITSGKIILDGEDITNAKPDERARAGLFLSFQYPSEITGITISTFLRNAVNSSREKPYPVIEFYKLLKEKMAELNIPSEFSKRYLNEGFSGGEKKRVEILQMVMLEPKYAMLDETDSGLDTDSIRTVAEGINKVKGTMGVMVITHYNKFLEYIEPDTISIIMKGKIVQQGGPDLAQKIEKEGFTWLQKNN